MNATIYKIVIFDANENECRVEPIIFWDKVVAISRAADISKAEKIRGGNEIPCDTIYVYEEVADRQTGAFLTKGMIAKFEK